MTAKCSVPSSGTSRHHYRGDYRVLTASSGREGLEAARQLKRRGTPIALFLVDERMPEMTGTEMLAEVTQAPPRRAEGPPYRLRRHGGGDPWHQRRRARSLPAQAVGSARIAALSRSSTTSCRTGRATVRLPYDGIRVVGSPLSPQSYTIKEFLSRNGVPYQWLDVEADPSGARAGRRLPADYRSCCWKTALR